MGRLDIKATLTRCRHLLPLVTMDSQPFNGLEIRPDELRQLARQLNALADKADALHTTGPNWRATKVDLSAQQKPAATPLDRVLAGMTTHLKANRK